MTTPLVFNEAQYAKLASPGDREMFLLKWLSNLDAYLESTATREALKTTQERLEQILLEIAMVPPATHAKPGGKLSWLSGGGGNGTPGSPGAASAKPSILVHVPKPTRVIRDLTAKCLARLYEIGDMRRLGETMDAIQAVMQAKKKAVEREARMAALVCAGVLFEALSTKAGFRLLSCFNDFLAIVLKTIKTSAETISVRVEATRTLSKLLQGGGGKTASEAQAKEIIKTIRPNLQHKSPLLVLATISAFESLVFFTPYMLPDSSFDAESFIASSLLDLLSSSVLIIRRAAAKFVALLISNTISLSAVVPENNLEGGASGNAALSTNAKLTDPAFRAIAKSSGYQLKSASANTSVRNSLDVQYAKGQRATPGPSISVPPQPPATAAPAIETFDDKQRPRRETISMSRGASPTDNAQRLSSTRSSNDIAAQRVASPPMPAVGNANGSRPADARSRAGTPTPTSTPAAAAAAAAAAVTAGNGISLARALTWLSVPFIRAAASRELRAGIIDAYAALFEELGTKVVESHYALILNHILIDLASSAQIPGSSAIDSRSRGMRPGLTHAIGTPSNVPTNAFISHPDNSGIGNSAEQQVVDSGTGLAGALDARAEADILALRNMCAWLLRVPIAQKLLTEQGKANAAQAIWNAWLVGSLPADVRALVEGSSQQNSMVNLAAAAAGAVLPWRYGQPSSNSAIGGGGSEVALLIVLQEWRSLIEDLGEACGSLDVFQPIPTDDDGEIKQSSYYSDPRKNTWMVPLENWLGYPNEAVRISAAACLGSLMRYDRSHMSRVVATLVSRLQHFCAHCAAHSSPTLDAMKRCIGYAYGISSVVAMGAASSKPGRQASPSQSPGASPSFASDSLLDIPLDLVEWVHSIAIRLLNSAYQRTEPEIVEHGQSTSKRSQNSRGRVVAGVSSADPANVGASLGTTSAPVDRGTHDRKHRGSGRTDRSTALLNMWMNTGWILLTGLASLGPEFIAKRAHTEWLRLWITAMPQPDGISIGGFVTADMPWYVRSHQLQSRYMALSHFLAYLRASASDTSGASSLTGNEFKQILACLRVTLMFADNALDAPPPPLRLSTGRTSSNTNAPRRTSISVQSYDIIDPARPTWELPTQTSILTSHMQIRDRVVECLQVFTQPARLSSMTSTITRLIEQVLASADNLLEIYGDKIGDAVMDASRNLRHRKDASMRPNNSQRAHATNGPDVANQNGAAGFGADAYSCLRGFRSGPWGYESETGVTTLLHAIVGGVNGAQDMSSDQQSSDNITDGSTASKDFANCHMFAPEFDWVSTLCPVASAFLGTQPISSISCKEIAATGANSRFMLTLQPAPSPYTKLVDDSIQLFGHLFPSLSENAQMTLLDDLVLRLNRLPFNSHRYIAVLTNILSALYSAIQGYALVRQGLILTEQQAEISPRVARAVVEMCRAALILPSPAHRLLAGEIIGYLATFTRDVSAAYLPYLLDHLTNQAIRSRDRFARAGTAVALGSLYSHAGSIVAGGSLKQVVVLLHSLASDKDPIVHTWAISALAEAAMSAGFMFEPYARDTFKMALKLFLSDSHAFPLYASAQWIRGKEHSAGTATDCASYERVLPLRSLIDPAAWSRQAAQQFAAAASENAHAADSHGASIGLGNIVAIAKDAAITHPNSTTHHGRSSDEQRDVATVAAAAGGGEGDYQYVCARSDMDAYDARAAIGHLVSSLILVFGPELQVDDATRDSVLTLLRELRRSLPSVGVPVPPLSAKGAPLSPIVDPDSRWQTAAQYIFATQKQLLFFPPREPEFLPLLVRQTLRPILQTRRVMYYGYSAGLHSFQHVSVSALDSVLRLYGDRVVEALESNSGADWADWSMSDIVWEALALHSNVCEQCDVGDAGCSSLALIADLRKLVRSTINLVVGHEYRKLESLCAQTDVHFDETGENAEGIIETLTLVETLCSVFTKRAGAVPTLGSRKSKDPVPIEGVVIDNVRQFNTSTKQVAVVAIIAILGVIDCVRPPASALNAAAGHKRQWRSHPLISLLSDLVRVGYMAATSPASESSTLCCLGLHLLQRLIDQFCDVEDPAMPGEGMPILSIYQAQLNSAFMPALCDTPNATDSSASDTNGRSAVSHSSLLRQAAVNTATAYLVSGLVTDRGSQVRILRLLAPQITFKSILPADSDTTKHKGSTSGDLLDTTTPQTHIITRLTTLRTWSVILEYAIKTRNEGLLDVVQLHMPILSHLWLSAIRDTAVLGMEPRDIYDELHVLANIAGSTSEMAQLAEDSSVPDIGLGLNLGLESTYVELVRESLAIWYRYYLPVFLSSISLLLSTAKQNEASKSAGLLKSGHGDLVWHLQSTSAISIPNAHAAEASRLPTQSSVLLLSFILQELSRLAKLSSPSQFASQASIGDSAGDPLVWPTVNRLLGSLDVDGADGNQGDNEAERVASLVRSGISVYGPTSSTSNIAVKWSSDTNLLSSLLSALCALLELSEDLHFSALFSKEVGANGNHLWLIQEIWTQAVTIPLQPLVTSTEIDPSDGGSGVLGLEQRNQVTKQQYDNLVVRVDIALKSMDISKALLGCLASTGASDKLDSWIFDGTKRDYVGSGSVFGSLGLSTFGHAILEDAVGVWRFARYGLVRSTNNDAQLTTKLYVLVSGSLHIIAAIISASLARCDSNADGDVLNDLVAFWLNLWRESLFSAGPSMTAYTALNQLAACCSQKSPSPATESVDILTGDPLDKETGGSQLVSSMISSLLSKLLESEDEAVLSKALAVAACVLANSETHDTASYLVLPPKLKLQFVDKVVCLLAESPSGCAKAIEVFELMAAPSKTSFAATRLIISVLPMLAKQSIPIIAKLLYQQVDQDLGVQFDVDRLLNILVMFAATSYSSADVGGPIMAAILMLLLSMLPDNGCQSSIDAKITEAILNLASISPDLFKAILIRISSSQPTAKNRLESAIRSRATSQQQQQQQQQSDFDGEFGDGFAANQRLRDNDETGAPSSSSAAASKISLKSSFAGF